jgi:hypothetical protein
MAPGNAYVLGGHQKRSFVVTEMARETETK